MPISFGKNTAQGISAGIAIHSDCLRFVELDENNNPVRQETVPLMEGCIQNSTIKNFDMLEAAFTEIYKLVGRLHEPVIIGLPNGDTIIRMINLPNMSIEDVRGTIDLNFDEYFPYPRPDAVFDTLRVITPANINNDKDDITALTVAAKKETIERILDIARKTGLPAGAVEPLSFSMLRAIPEADEGLSIFANPDTVIAVYEGNGIFFRSANNLNSTQDILNTMQFIETTYRNMRVNKLILSGLKFQIRADSGMNVVNIPDEYFAAKSLALRNQENAQKLELCPGEYVELERRRYSFNPNRLIFWGLLAGFVILSIGTISFTWLKIHDIELALEDKRVSNADLMTQRAVLSRRNAELEKKQKETERILNFLKGDIPVLEIMNAIEKHFTAGVKLDNANFSRNAETGVSVVIDGKAVDEGAVLAMTEGLKNSGAFSEVRLPVSLRAMTGQVIFKLILRVKEVI